MTHDLSPSLELLRELNIVVATFQEPVSRAQYILYTQPNIGANGILCISVEQYVLCCVCVYAVMIYYPNHSV